MLPPGLRAVTGLRPTEARPEGHRYGHGTAQIDWGGPCDR